MPEYWAMWCAAEPSNPSGFAFTFNEDLAKDATEEDRSLIASQLGPIEARCCQENDLRVTGTSSDGFFSLQNTVYPLTSVELRKTPGKGRGLFASTRIRAGSLIFGEYPYALAFQEQSMPNADEQTEVFEGLLQDFSHGHAAPETIPADRFLAHTSAILCDSCFCDIQSGEEHQKHMQTQLGGADDVVSGATKFMLQDKNARDLGMDSASFRTLFSPAYCSNECRNAAILSHVPMMYPSRQNWPTSKQPSMVSDVLHPDQVTSVTTLVQNCSLLQWTTGLRVFRLFSTFQSRMKFASNASRQVSDADWWTSLDSKDWAFALAPWDAFDRPSYTCKTEGVTLKSLLTKRNYEIPLYLPDTPVEPVTDGLFQDYFEEDPDGPACSVHMLWLLLCTVVDQLIDPQGNAPVKPSSVLVPIELQDRILGMVSTNCQIIGSVPSLVRNRDVHLLSSWSTLHTQLNGNKELGACALQSGLFPWHAMLNHSCKPNAHILPAQQTPLLSSLTEQPILPKVFSACVFIVATRDINPGDEIAISYADELTPEPAAYKQATSAKLKAKLQAQEVLLADTMKQRFGWTCRCTTCLLRLKSKK